MIEYYDIVILRMCGLFCIHVQSQEVHVIVNVNELRKECGYEFIAYTFSYRVEKVPNIN